MGSEMGSETGSEMGSEMSLYFCQTFVKVTRYLNAFDQSKKTSHYPSKYFFPKLLR